MRVNPTTCGGCGRCATYCPVDAIRLGAGGVSEVERDACVECGVCRRSARCPTGSLVEEELAWPRSLRKLFSDPLTEHRHTRVPGRGTEEMKTNDVTGRYPRGQAGLMIELGRPGVGARLGDAQVLTTALAERGLAPEPANPLSQLIVDPERGLLDPEVLEERVLSAAIEVQVPLARLAEVLSALRAAGQALPTVFSVGVITQAADAGALDALAAAGFAALPNGKTNVGLGRPRAAGGEA